MHPFETAFLTAAYRSRCEDRVAVIEAIDRVGASVGDSVAWLVHEGAIIDLTGRQIRKPRLGTQAAVPIGFTHGPLEGVLLVAADGLANYVRRESLPRQIATAEFLAIPRQLVEAVRLPSGDLWDDVGLVVCRRRPMRAGKRTYAI